MFKIETHLHTAESSRCGKVEAAEMVRLYAEAGYKTVIVTDHMKSNYFRTSEDDTWEDEVDRLLLGYRNAAAVAEKYGVNVIMGVEFELGKIPNHYLTYGITEELMKANPDICNMTAQDFYRLMNDNGVFVIQAHPNRDNASFPTPDAADGFEIYNSNPRHDDYSEKSEADAKKYNMLVTSGSDAHRLDDLALGGMLSEKEIKTTEDFVALVRSGKGELIR